MPVTVQCAVCDTTTVMQTSKEVYGDADPFAPEYTQGVTQRRVTGWRAGGVLGAPVYFCPAHADEPEAYATRTNEWLLRLEAVLCKAAEKWKAANPAPLDGWKAWDRPDAP
jgi:hypothetical protein